MSLIRSRRRCPHLRVRCVHADEINFLRGRRRVCLDCSRALDGPLPEPCSVTGERHDVTAVDRRLRYWFDTEFIEDGRTIELLSIGVVCEDGREFYAENRYANLSRANEWVKENVVPHLRMGRGDKIAAGATTPTEIALNLHVFVSAGHGQPEFWAYYGDYDWVVLCQLYGRMIDLPDGWPMFAMDVKQLAVSLGDPTLPEQTSAEHHALADARWTRDAWCFLTDLYVTPHLSEEDEHGK